MTTAAYARLKAAAQAERAVSFLQGLKPKSAALFVAAKAATS